MSLNNGATHKANIVYERYYDFTEERVVSGGVQTYITNLLPLLRETNYIPEIYQFGKEMKSTVINDCIVTEVPNSKAGEKYITKVVLDYIQNDFDNEYDLLIFADHILTEDNNAMHSLSIQHGIHWDIPKETSRNMIHMFLSKARFAYNEHKRMKFVNQVVCVDYNFLNWYRTQVDQINSNFIVIPNFTAIAEINEKPEDTVKIIFARRFVKHRGTRVFADAAEKLLLEYSNIEITVAGRGPDEKFLHKKLDVWGSKVVFTQYTSDQALSIHADKHIAVVPTVGSEGTSLSLLEAMSAQCAVVCTNVGGMTNIVIDQYNGRMVNAGDSDQLYKAIKNLIDNPKERQRIAMTGYDTVKKAFSHECWSNRWREVLKTKME